MRALDAKCGSKILKAIFFEQFPSHVRGGSAMSKMTKVDKLASTDDSFMKSTDSGCYSVLAVSLTQSALDIIMERLEKISTEINETKNSKKPT